MFPIRFFDDWNDAREHYQNPEWENITLEARNTLTTILKKLINCKLILSLVNGVNYRI